MRLKTLPIFLAFFLMGLADAMGPNVGQSERVLRHQQRDVDVVVVCRLHRLCRFSVPGGLLAARIGKKNLLLLGLGLNAASLVIPSVMVPNFWVLLGCIFLLGVGTTFLQVAGNPIMRDVSAEGKYSRNLAFAQGIKGIGSTASTLSLDRHRRDRRFQEMDWRAGFPFFCGLMISGLRVGRCSEGRGIQSRWPPSIGSSLGLLKEPIFFLAVLGIFLYVGAEVCMGRFLLARAAGFWLERRTTANNVRPDGVLLCC